MGEAIVVGTDGSESAGHAVAEAVRLAKALDAELHVVSAYKPLRDAHIRGRRQALQRCGHRCRMRRWK